MIWKPLPTNPDIEISDTGELRSVSGLPIKRIQANSTAGPYLYYYFPDPGMVHGSRRASAAALMIEAFKPPRYRYSVRYKDRDPGNLTLDNIVAVPRGVPVRDDPDLPGEVWKPIPQTDGVYEASSLGRVRRIASRTLIKPALVGTKRGYYAFHALVGDGANQSILVHVAVLTAFAGVAPEGHVADHINRITTDNRPENLRWVTPAMNAANSKERDQLCAGSYALHTEQIAGILAAHACGVSQYKLVQILGVPLTTVGSIVHQKTKRSREIAAVLGLLADKEVEDLPGLPTLP